MPSEDNLVKLIKSVQKHPKLFTNLAEDIDNDDEEWSAVAKECKMSAIGAQTKWNLLLTEYVEYLKNGEGFNLAQHMEFLQPYFFTMLDDENIDEEELSKAIDSKTLEENVDSKKNVKMEETDKTEVAAITIFSENTEFKPSCESISDVTVQDSSFTNLSPLELIFFGYAKQLQNMPLALQLKIKRKIADIMDEAELSTSKV